jgi:hypothetical protein
MRNPLAPLWRSGLYGTNPIAGFLVLLCCIAIGVLTLWAGLAAGDFGATAVRDRGARLAIFIIAISVCVLSGFCAAAIGADPGAGTRRARLWRRVLRGAKGFGAAALGSVALLFLWHWEWLVRAPVSAAQDFRKFALLPSLIAFSTLWTLHVLVHGVVRIVRESTPTRSALGMARGLIGAAVCAGTAAWIASQNGADLARLYAPRDFYIVTVPAVAGFGWTAAWPTSPSRAFRICVLVLGFCMAAFTLRPFPVSDIRCQYWFPTGIHSTGGLSSVFEYEPWHWRIDFWPDLLFTPGALGEMTVLYIKRPLTNIRC